MTAKTAKTLFGFLCFMFWAAFDAAALPVVRVVKLQENEHKLVTITNANMQLHLAIENLSQTAEIEPPHFYNAPLYFVLRSGAKPQTYTFFIDKKYPESAQLQYAFHVTDIETGMHPPKHDAVSLSRLNLEQRANELTRIHCQGDSFREKLDNQSSLFALEALRIKDRYNDMIAFFRDSCINDDTVMNLQAVLARSYLALAHLEQSNFQSAIEHFEAIIGWYNENQDASFSVRAMHDISAHFGLAATIFARITKSDDLRIRGRNSLEQAHQYFVENGFEVSSIYSLAHLWSVYAMNKEHQQALTALLLSNQIIEAIAPGLVEQKIINLNHKSITHMFTGNTSSAIETMRQAINLSQSSVLNHIMASIYLNLGSQYLQIGDFELGKKYYLRVKDYIEKNRSDVSKGNINDGLALVALRTGHFERAKRYLEQAMTYFRENPGYLAKSQTRLGYVLTLEGKYQEAQVQLNSAGKYYQADKVSAKNLRFYIRLAMLYVAQKNAVAAQQIIDNIDGYLSTLPTNFDTPSGALPLSLSRQIDYLELKVDLFRLQGDVLKQRDHLKQLNHIIRTVSAGLDTARAGPVWADYTSRIVTKYNETLFQAYQRTGDKTWLEELFIALETHTAFSARRQRAMAQNTDKKSIDHNFLQSLYLFQVEQAEQALFSAGTGSQKMEAQLALNEAREKFRLSSASIKQTEFEMPSVPTLAQTQNMLRSNEVVLRFFELDGTLYRYVINPNVWRVEQVGITSSQARELVSQIDPDKLNIRDRHLQKLAMLIPKDILDTAGFDKLIIVNSGPNHYVPYAALNVANDELAYQPLMERFSVVVPFHLGSYLRDDSIFEVIDPSITIFADPFFYVDGHVSVTEEIESNETKRSWLQNIQSLPATKQEADSIGKILKNWNVNPLLNKDATHHALLSKKSRSSTILHIASHGYFNEQTPDVIGVATSVRNHHNERLPGFLSLRSMLAVPFTSKLIVVSGCETGMGRELKGEGLVSLARGLIGQGAGGVISTLWEIPDRPTALFMRYFYEGLIHKNGDVPSALAHAQQKLMSTGRYKSPRYWAGFTYTGGSRGNSVIAM